jgi:hypothetical protein
MRTKRGFWVGPLGVLWVGALSAAVGCSDSDKGPTEAIGGEASGGSGASAPTAGTAGQPSAAEAGAGGGDAGGGGCSGVECSAAGKGGEGGDGGDHSTARALALLTSTVMAQVGESETLTDPDDLAGYSFELQSYLGPFLDWDGGWPGYGELGIQPPLLARPTFHIVEDDEGIALVSELPSEIFTYAERLPLERVGDAWLVKKLTTSVHTAWASDAFWTTADYHAALAVLAFVDDEGHGKPNRVVVSATDGFAAGAVRDDYSDVTVLGTASGLSLAQGRPGLSRMSVRDVSDKLPPHNAMNAPALNPPTLDGIIVFGDRAILALEPPVAIDSTFHFENSQGDRSEVRRVVSHGFVIGIVPDDYVPDGWNLVGSGTALNGEPFELSRQINVVREAIATGDFESATQWAEPCFSDPSQVSQVLSSYQGLPALAGTRSFLAEGCPRLRLSRAPGATELKLDAVLGADGLTIAVTAVAPRGSTRQTDIERTGEEVQAITVPLPPGEGDILVTFSSAYGAWIDSVRTE